MTTEEKILKAAEIIFVKEGYDGARMQEIATEAGINKALLHYYFRSKEKLFEKIFLEKKKEFLPKFGGVFFSELSAIEKVEFFIDNYIDLLVKNPFLPIFIFTTVHKNPEFIKELPQPIFLGMLDFLRFEMERGKVRKQPPEQLIFTILGMCIFPFLARPVIKNFLSLEDEQFNQMIEGRRVELKQNIRLLMEP